MTGEKWTFLYARLWYGLKGVIAVKSDRRLVLQGP